MMGVNIDLSYSTIAYVSVPVNVVLVGQYDVLSETGTSTGKMEKDISQTVPVPW